MCNDCLTCRFYIPNADPRAGWCLRWGAYTMEADCCPKWEPFE